MTKKEVLKLISLKENTNLEFKRTIDNPYKIARTLAALANTSGGFLLVGIDDDKTIVGINSEIKEIEKIYLACTELIVPILEVSYQVLVLESKAIIVIKVPKTDIGLYTSKQPDQSLGIYVRAKDKTIPIGKSSANMMAKENLKVVSTVEKNELIVKNLMIYLQKNERITTKLLAKITNISEHRANRVLMNLTQKGVLLYLDTLNPKSFCLRIIT